MIDLGHIAETILVPPVQLIELSLELSCNQRREQMTLIVLGRRAFQLDLDGHLQLLLKQALIADQTLAHGIIGYFIRPFMLVALLLPPHRLLYLLDNHGRF